MSGEDVLWPPPQRIGNDMSVEPKRIEGTLYRRSTKMGTVHKRKFALDEGMLMYVSPKEESVAINMAHVKEISRTNAPAYELGLHMWNGQLLKLRTETRTEYKEWELQLNAHMNSLQRSLTIKMEGKKLTDVRGRTPIEGAKPKAQSPGFLSKMGSSMGSRLFSPRSPAPELAPPEKN